MRKLENAKLGIAKTIKCLRNKTDKEVYFITQINGKGYIGKTRFSKGTFSCKKGTSYHLLYTLDQFALLPFKADLPLNPDTIDWWTLRYNSFNTTGPYTQSQLEAMNLWNEFKDISWDTLH